MATATTSEIVRTVTQVKAPFSMIEGKGLWARLAEQLSQAVTEFKRDPRAFLQDLFFDDNKDLQRSKRIRLGFAVGLMTNVVLIAVIVVLGMRHSQQVTGQLAENDSGLHLDGWVPPDPLKPENKQPDPATKAPEMPKGKGNGGDTGAPGGGGMNQPTQPKLGTPPQMAPLPPVMSPIAPSMPQPSLPMNPTVEGPPSPPPPPEATIGSPTGVKDGGAGPGTDGGIGKGKGGGVGDNVGGGTGEKVAGTGGGDLPGAPGGKAFPTGPVPWNLLRTRYSESTDVQWISRPRPAITPEAQAAKVSGTVLLKATFNADGTITDIEIVNPVPGMTQSAIDALMRSKFRPATVYGKPITLTKVPVRINVSAS